MQQENDTKHSCQSTTERRKIIHNQGVAMMQSKSRPQPDRNALVGPKDSCPYANARKPQCNKPTLVRIVSQHTSATVTETMMSHRERLFQVSYAESGSIDH